MPTYDYRCTACAHEFEEFQSMSAPVLRTCPACKKKSLERLIGTGAAVLFKGSGFYQTDYRSEGDKKAAKADSNTPAAGDGSAAKPTAPAAPSDAGSKGTSSTSRAPAPKADPDKTPTSARTPAKPAP